MGIYRVVEMDVKDRAVLGKLQSSSREEEYWEVPEGGDMKRCQAPKSAASLAGHLLVLRGVDPCESRARHPYLVGSGRGDDGEGWMKFLLRRPSENAAYAISLPRQDGTLHFWTDSSGTFRYAQGPARASKRAV